MKKIGIYLMALFMTVGLSVFAQPQGKKHIKNRTNKEQCAAKQKTPQERATWIAKQLELTKQQEQELVKYYEKIDKEKATKRSERKANREKIRAERQKNREQHRADLEEIIGKDKMKELDKSDKK